MNSYCWTGGRWKDKNDDDAGQVALYLWWTIPEVAVVFEMHVFE